MTTPPPPGPYDPGNAFPPPPAHIAGAQQPYPSAPAAWPTPPTMPSAVRAAQVLAFVAAGLALLTAVAAGTLEGPRAVGAAIGATSPVIGVFVCALLFGRAGSGAKVTAIVFASFVILMGVGMMGRGIPLGLVLTGLGIAIVCALSQRQSGVWFRRNR